MYVGNEEYIHIFTIKTQRPHARPKRRFENNIKMDSNVVGR